MGQVPAKASSELAANLTGRLPSMATLQQSETHILQRPSLSPWGFVEHSYKAWGLHFTDRLANHVQFLRRRSVLLNRGRTQVSVGTPTRA